MVLALMAGQDYPNTYRNFVEMFPDNSACVSYLMHLRWPERFVCPSCKTSSVPWNESRGSVACHVCRHQTSITTGTIFDKSRAALKTWFEVAWHVINAKNGKPVKNSRTYFRC